MKSILLASVATVAFAGAAAAEITWSGTGSVSVGRTGSVAAVAGAMTDAQALEISDADALELGITAAADEWDDLVAADDGSAEDAFAAWWADATAAEKADALTAAGLEASTAAELRVLANDVQNAQDAYDAAILAGDADDLADEDGDGIYAMFDLDDSDADVTTLTNEAADLKDAKTALALAKLNTGSDAVAAGATKMTATGTLTAAMTVGDGYVASLSFNAGTGAFGALSLATPDMGTLTFSPNAIAGLVDASDKGADLKYTNTVGGWAVAVTLDVDADTAEKGSAADARNLVAAVASDSQWSVSASGTLSEGTTASVAFDQEGGYAMGVSTTAAGFDLSLGTSMTAAAGAVNTLGVGYSMGDISLGLDYSSEDPANTYALSVGYAMDATSVSLAYQQNADYDLSIATSVAGFAVTLATDEDAAWSMSASTPIGTAGTLTASTNSKSAMALTAAFKF